MDDFFRQFRENLESRPEPPFEEGDWRQLENRLAEQGERRPPVIFWWWALPLLLLFTGVNAWMLLEQRKVSRKIDAMEARRDTVYHTRVVYITDTIYQSRAIKEEPVTLPFWRPLAFSIPFGNAAPPAPDGYAPLLPGGQLPEGLLPAEGGQLTSTLSGIQQQAEAPAPPAEGPADGKFYYAGKLLPLPTAGFRQLSGPYAENPDLPLEPTLTKRRRPLLAYLYPLRPKGLQLGLNGGAVLPVGHKMAHRSGFSAGLQASVVFSPSLRMWAGANYFKIYLETDQMDDAMGVPLITPPSDELVFVKADVLMPSFQFSGGMQYLFRADKKWRPYVGLGYAAVSLLPHDVIYDFKNPDNDTEWNLDTRVQSSRWHTGFILFQAGAEYEFSRLWRGQLGVSYRTNWDNAGLLSPRMIGLSGGVLYKF